MERRSLVADQRNPPVCMIYFQVDRRVEERLRLLEQGSGVVAKSFGLGSPLSLEEH